MLGAAGTAGRAGLRKVREGAALGEGVSVEGRRPSHEQAMSQALCR